MKNLFEKLYKAQNEIELQHEIDSNQIFQDQNSWYPLGNNENNFSTIENQQASSIGALIEKFTNSIDATLMKQCYEHSIDPRSQQAPKTMQEAVELFYGEKYKWLNSVYSKQESLNIQVIADGSTKQKSARTYDTSLIIYDNGEGQHPEDFESTFLSIGKGNKNDILFVQGKYNMGGTGSIVFCGKNRYQLIASKRYDKSGKFGFTLIRKHPFSEEDKKTKKNTWYEYFKINGEIPSFDIDSIDLGLHEKEFTTGSIIKLYSYDLPEGARSVISKDLRERVDEYLFEPALPILMVDKKERYPDDRNLQRISFGLKRRLEKGETTDNKYIDDYFILDHESAKTGHTKITSYVFKTKINDKSVKESRNIIKNEFFRSNMYVVFTMNGQVQGHLTSEFITRSLKLPLLKDHLLIHVDCTNMEYDFRSQLFMASRDRLKEGEEYRYLRELLTNELKNSKLDKIHKDRKDSISIDSSNTKDLIKSFTKNLPLNSDLLKLLNNTFDLDQKDEKKKEAKNQQTNKTSTKEEQEFIPKRFPSFFNLSNSKNGINAIKIPKGKSKTIKFDTDVENHYFDRDDDAGELNISIVDIKNNETSGGDKPGEPKDISETFDVSKSSPENGKIKLSLNPTEDLEIGDNIQIKVELTSPDNNFKELILIEITEPQKEQSSKPKEEENEKFGLPELILTSENPTDNKIISWDKLNDNSIDMSYNNILYIYSSDGEKLEKIYINLDSTTLKNHKSKLNSNELREKAEKEYIAKVYFHTLFLYSINKNSKYKISKHSEGNSEEYIEINEYIQNLFENQYTSFLINFNMNDLIDTMEF
ncbi:MAG: hypothetical protein ABIJ02_10375 [Pseudomonadota bacterium]